MTARPLQARYICVDCEMEWVTDWKTCTRCNVKLGGCGRMVRPTQLGKASPLYPICASRGYWTIPQHFPNLTETA